MKCNDSSCTGLFLTLFYKFAFYQFVLSPTRDNNVLDLILSNDCNCVFNVNVVEPFSSSDHNSVEFHVLSSHVSNSLPQSQSRLFYHNFNRADWDGMHNFLANVNFNNVFGNDSIELICDDFYRILHYCIDKYVPLKSLNTSVKHSGPRYPASIRN